MCLNKKILKAYALICPLVVQMLDPGNDSFSNTRLPVASVRSFQECACDFIPMPELPVPELITVSCVVSDELNVNELLE